MGACFEGFGLSHFGRTNLPSVARKVNAFHDVSEEVCHRDCRIGWLVKEPDFPICFDLKRFTSYFNMVCCSLHSLSESDESQEL